MLSPKNLEAEIDELFTGCRDVPRLLHVYDDGLKVEILNGDVGGRGNGGRVFHKNDEIIAFYSGYSIEKYIVSTDESVSTREDTASAIKRVVDTLPPIGTLYLTNDGPLLLVFKIAGKVRLQMMRSANHGFEQQFSQDFADQYDGAKFEDLFPESIETSTYCHLFRQGSRTTAMLGSPDLEGRTLLYMGCETVVLRHPTPQGDADAHLTPRGDDTTDLTPTTTGILHLNATPLSVGEATTILRTKNSGLVCYRHIDGEVQLISEEYLQRIATMTGISVSQLVSGEVPSDESSYRPLELESNLFARLSSSRFPRVLDLLALYILCGTNPGKKTPTVDGFSVYVNPGGRLLAKPKRGFYNFCRAAGVNPRQQLAFPATPSSVRLAIRRIILQDTLPDRSEEVQRQFDNYEMALFQLVPQMISKVMSGSVALSQAFETAFGITAMQLVQTHDILNPSSSIGGRGAGILKTIRSSLLLCDRYRLITITRFALRHLLDSGVSSSSVPSIPASTVLNTESHLIALLSEYSNSSRRRRQVAERITDSHQLTTLLGADGAVDGAEDLDDTDEWPLLAQ